VRAVDHWTAATRVVTADDAAVFEGTAGTWLRPRLLLDVVAQLPTRERATIVLHY
jgi:hypothetical protein